MYVRTNDDTVQYSSSVGVYAIVCVAHGVMYSTWLRAVSGTHVHTGEGGGSGGLEVKAQCVYVCVWLN